MNLSGNLTRLRYFQAVCKYNGMTKAAEALCVSQPSLTTAIKDSWDSVACFQMDIEHLAGKFGTE